MNKAITSKTKKRKSEALLGMAFFGPALVLLSVFLFIPMILTLIFSFTDFFALNPGITHFVGLENYFQIFRDEDFRQAFGNTVNFVLIIVPLQGLGALILALLINKVTHCKKYFKVAFFIPVVMSLAVVSTLWIQIFSPEGILNSLLGNFGIAPQPFINIGAEKHYNYIRVKISRLTVTVFYIIIFKIAFKLCNLKQRKSRIAVNALNFIH